MALESKIFLQVIVGLNFVNKFSVRGRTVATAVMIVTAFNFF